MRNGPMRAEIYSFIAYTDYQIPHSTRAFYGVRHVETYTLEAQLDAALGRKSKIEDGSAGGKGLASTTAVSDFRLPSLVEPQLRLQLRPFRHRPILSGEVIGSACCRRLSRLPTSSTERSQLVRPRPLRTEQPLPPPEMSPRSPTSTRPSTPSCFSGASRVARSLVMKSRDTKPSLLLLLHPRGSHGPSVHRKPPL